MSGYVVDTNYNGSSSAVRVNWWEADEGRAHEIVLPLLKRLIQQDAVRRRSVLRLMKMAGNYSHTGLGFSQEMDPNRLRYNLIGQAADTLIAEVTMTEPKASFEADGDWLIRQAAKKREALNEAQMRTLGWWSEVKPACLRDAIVTGTGLAYAYVDPVKADLCVERVIPLECVVEESDARYGKPMVMIRQRPIDRHQLAAAFPDYAEQIKDPKVVRQFAPSGDDEWILRDATMGDLVLIVQAWRLPTSKDAGDGKYVVCLDGLDIHESEYKHDRHQLLPLVFKRADTGFWGRSLAEDLYPDQIELNRTLMAIQDAFKAAAPMMLVPREGKIKLRHLTDIPGAVVEYSSGMKPEYYAPTTINGEMYAHADRIITRALNRVGINEMATAGSKPAGLDSGEAIRSYRDQFSMRQNPLAKQYEGFTVEMAKLFDMLNRDLYALLCGEDDGEGDAKSKMPAYPVEFSRGRRKILKKMRWDEVDKPENEFVIQAFSVNGLTSDPSGLQALISEMLAAGELTPDQAKRLMREPSGLDDEIRLDEADFDFAMFAYSTMVEDNEYVQPESYQAPYTIPLEVMRRAYLRGRIDGVPDERLGLVRRHMTALSSLMTRAKSGLAPAQPLQPPAPMMLPQQPAPDLPGLIETPANGIAA